MGILVIFQYGQFGNISKQMLFGYFCNISNKRYEIFLAIFQNKGNMGTFGGKIERHGYYVSEVA